MADPATRGKSAGDIHCQCTIFNCKCTTIKFLTVKMKVKVVEHNIRNGDI